MTSTGPTRRAAEARPPSRQAVPARNEVQARRQQRTHPPVVGRSGREARQRHQRLVRRAGFAGVAVVAAGLIGLAVVLPSGKGSSAGSMGATSAGPAVGSNAPDFSLTDVSSGKQVTLASLRGHKTLLFFSEGVSCQACLVQAADLQKTTALSDAGIRLVSITTDPTAEMAQAAHQYGITGPLLADPSTSMSDAYGMLGHGGMEHSTQDGHAFMLLSANGTVLWHRAYQSMYVPTSQLLSDIGVKA